MALGLLFAFAGGLLLAVAAGADRSSSAFSRLEASEHAPDGYLFLPPEFPEQEVEHLPQVAAAAYATVLAEPSADYTPVVLNDPRYGRDVSRFKLLSGRRPASSHEAMVDFTLARSLHFRVGSTVTMRPPTGGGTTRLAPVTVRVVGVIADARAFPPMAYAATQAIYLDASFLATPEAQAWLHHDGSALMVGVRLHQGLAQWSPFLQGLEGLSEKTGSSSSQGNAVGSTTQAAVASGPQKSMHLQSMALWLTAGFGALVLLVIMAQLLLRQLSEHSATAPALRSLGMTGVQLVAADVVWTLSVAVGGAAVAALVAYAASPLFPLGTARVADPHPGATFDALVVVPGLAVLALAVVAAGTMVSARLARQRRRPGYVPAGGGRLIPSLQRLPVAVATGVRLALTPGRGRSAVPVRSTIGAAAVGVTGVIVAMTFASSLGHLLSTPRLYGTTYDADIEMNANFGNVEKNALPGVLSDPDVEAAAVSDTGVPLVSGHTSFGGEWLDSRKGSILPVVVAGRLPEAPDEILLGVQTLSSLHTRIGRTVPIAVDGITKPLPMRVVGSGVLATADEDESLGKGAVVNRSAMDRFLAAAPPGFLAPPPGDLYVRFKPGLDPAREIPALTARLGGIDQVVVTAPTQPTDVADFGQVRALPQVLAGLLAAFAAATMAYLLVSAVRRRRRELAVLKTLGFVPAQISAVVAWQSTTIAVAAMVVGVPAGIIGGRAVWSAVANQMGVVVSTTVPWPLLAALVPIVIVLANLVAAGPAAVAARISASTALRDE